MFLFKVHNVWTGHRTVILKKLCCNFKDWRSGVLTRRITLTGVNILFLDFNDLYERFGFFFWTVPKNKELKWSENILPKQAKKNKQKKEWKERKKKSGSENKNSQNEFLKKTISKNNPKKLPLLLKNKHSYKLPSSTHVTKCCIGKMTKQKYWNSY